MKRFVSLSVLGFLPVLGACADTDPSTEIPDEEVESTEDAIVETKTVSVSKDFPRPFDRDFTKTFSKEFRRGGFRATPTLTAKAHLDINTVRIAGSVTYTRSRLGRFKIIEGELKATGKYDADAELQLNLQGSGDLSVLKTLAASDWRGTPFGGDSLEIVSNVLPTNIPIGGPLFVHVHFDLGVECGVEVDGEISARTGVGVAGDLDVTAKYDRNRQLPGNKKFAFQASAPNFRVDPKPWLKFDQKAELHGRCALQPTVVILFEATVGAKISLEPYVDVTAEGRGVPPRWSFAAKAGVVGHAETDVEVFGHPLFKPKEFTLFDKQLWSGTL